MRSEIQKIIEYVCWEIEVQKINILVTFLIRVDEVGWGGDKIFGEKRRKKERNSEDC